MPFFSEPPGLPDRVAPQRMREQVAALETTPALLAALQAAPLPVIIVNPEFQVVFANQRLLDFIGADACEEVRGLRTGEVLACENSTEDALGCGASRFCSACGILRTLTAAQLGAARTETCRLVRRTASGQDAVEFEVSAAPLSVDGRQYVVAFAGDVRDRLRSQWIGLRLLPGAGEIAHEISALTKCLGRVEDPALLAKIGAALKSASDRLSCLLSTHRNLVAAQGGRLDAVQQPLSSLDLMRDCAEDIRALPLAEGRLIRIDPQSDAAPFAGDPLLVREVLAAFLLNALEAEPPGAVVTLCSRSVSGAVEFSVHSRTVMPHQVQLQVFSSGFSTRGPGRGFGTWSAKFIAERFLSGSVSFESNEELGTVFLIRLPAKEEKHP